MKKYNALVESAKRHVEIVFGTVIEEQSIEIGSDYYIQTSENARNESEQLDYLIEDNTDYSKYNYWLEDAVGNYPIGRDTLEEIFYILQDRNETVDLYLVKQGSDEFTFFDYRHALETFEGFKELNYSTELISLSNREDEISLKYISTEEEG